MHLVVPPPPHNTDIVQRRGDRHIGLNKLWWDWFRQIRDLLSEVSNPTEPVSFPVYTVATLPAASGYAGHAVMVSDETGGYTMAFSNGTNWKRVQDLATVS